MKKIEKIAQYLENHDITIAEFERKANISNGYFKNTIARKSEISEKILDKIRQTWPDVYREVFNLNDYDDIDGSEKDENKKDHRLDDLIQSSLNNSEAVLISAKTIDRLSTMLQQHSNDDVNKRLSNLQNFAGLVEVVREIGIKAGLWQDADQADEVLRKFVAGHKI